MYVFFDEQMLKRYAIMNAFFNLLKVNIIILCTIFVSLSNAQSCKATAPSQVSVGQAFTYSVVLDEKATRIVSVNFDNFDVLGGPNQSFSSSMSMINGQTTQSKTYTYSYTLSASKTGNFTIPAAIIQVGKQQLKSNSVTISVSEASANSRKGANQTTTSAVPNIGHEDVFVKAYASKSNPYVGEEVIITHKLYVGQQVNGGYQITGVNAPSQSGFWAYTLGDPNQNAPESVETVNGKRYAVVEIRKTALFPQQSGKLTVTPFELDFVGRLIYSVRSNDPWDNFFGGGQRARDVNLKLKSNSITLNAKKLPETNQPDGFSGVVGHFTIKSSLSRTELKTNDAVNLIVTITGNGNLQYIDNLNVDFPADFDVTDPKITDNINSLGNTVSGSRTFEYVLIPRTEGNYTITPISFSFFDIKSNSYKTLKTDSLFIKVEKGSGDGITSVSSRQRDLKVLGNDIRFIKTDGKAFHPKRDVFFATPWYFFFLFLPFFFFVFFLLIWRKKIEENKNLALLKNKKANKVARKRLKRAAVLLSTNKKEEFYVEISQVLWGYMSDKFHIPLAQLSMETVAMRLKEKQLTDEAIQDFVATLEQCEYARFAPGDSSQQMHHLYNLSHQFITKIEKKS